ncbi:MAG: relaxase domain-containing protein [Ilumatobacter sp.]|nr:relaxase domain-containing protein [Ilumatobacter sp.]
MTTLHASSAASTAAYYTRYLTQADGEQPGRWTGRQADLLGLSGEVTTEQLEALLLGRDPISGTRLGYPLVDRVEKSGKVRKAVAGFDATFSAPKSLSVWWALTGDERLAECHDVAVRAVVDYLERYASTTRERSNGRRLHLDTNGLTCAVFRQTTSRLDDPQLHTHVVISGKVQTQDGRWLALDARTLKGFQRALGGLYQSVLRAEVTARFGVAWGDIVKGQADIAGFPAEVLEAFSKRAAQVDAAMQTMLAEFRAREGRDPTSKEHGAIGRRAAEDTRGHKTGTTPTDLRSLWRAEAAAVGVTPDVLEASIRAAALAAPVEQQRISVGEVVAAVGERRSAWHRLDVIQHLGDTVRPRPGIDGQRWARLLDRAADTVLDQCVDLDPTDTHTRRRSDGRSVWIEPSARHHTSEHILAQEEHILTWAIDHQLDPPRPSATIDASGSDVMQTEAAAAVAGSDQLVLVVGPAGAGKTTMLHAAVTDLRGQGRPVFGLAPTAKAARVLETGTGMQCDTVAKLLHEWTRPDRPPEPPWRLPAGTTVIVDEAGMLATADLHQLTQLADQHAWRLALVGDPHQLHSVARGGMFAELCATGRPIELDTIHRFHNDWEAAASLQLRHGDPSGLDAYLDHDRILPAPFHEHLDNIAAACTAALQRGEYVAITTTTNDHVDAINRAAQAHRLAAGQLGDQHLEIGDISLHVGDVVTTRRNQRLLRTTAGDSVRNRDYWTINAITADGGMAVTRIDGHGTVTLPASYVTDHVRLGYAATEPGNQSDTATASITLATPATTCRGLYVAVTRGRGENLICVVTDTHDIADAIDVLERILATDRADQPATRTRHQLATTIPPTTLRPRCEIPDWFNHLHHTARTELADTQAAHTAERHRDTETRQRIDQIGQKLADLEPHCAPHDQAIAQATTELHRAEQRRRDAERELASAGRLHRRSARHTLAEATDDVALVRTALDELTRRAQPLLDQRDQLRQEQQRLQQHRKIDQQLTRSLDRYANRLAAAQQRLDALDTWHAWATGHTPPPASLINAAQHLQHTGGHDRALAEPLATWIHQHDLAPRPAPAVQPAMRQQPRPEPPGLDIGF